MKLKLDDFDDYLNAYLPDYKEEYEGGKVVVRWIQIFEQVFADISYISDDMTKDKITILIALFCDTYNIIHTDNFSFKGLSNLPYKVGALRIFMNRVDYSTNIELFKTILYYLLKHNNQTNSAEDEFNFINKKLRKDKIDLILKD